MAERILVVDDDQPTREMLALALKRRDFEVELAEDGATALRLLAERPAFSVMLTDLMMPGMSGLDLLREAKKLDPHLEVVVITALADVDTAVSAMRAYGAYDYLLKPFESMRQLALSMERAAGHRRLLIEREVMQGQIRHEAEMLRTLVLNTGDAILSANGKDVLQIVNPAAERLVESSAVPGANALSTLPQPFVQLLRNWRAVGSSLPTVVELNWVDGSVQMISLTPLREAGEAETGWVAVLRDVTHLKQLEEMKMQLLIDASMKVRVPLALAMNALVELNIVTSQNEQAQEVIYRLSTIWSGIQKWSEDLNALMQMDRDAQTPETRLDLKLLLNEVCQGQAGALLEMQGIQLDLRLKDDLPLVKSNADLLRKLLHGLINRAVSRSERGGKIAIQVRMQNGQVWIGIHDQGPAVSNTELSHLFEKSFVGAGGMRGTTGLEMALVKKIIDRMGGQVWVGGQGNLGSTIFVCLPPS